MNTLMRTAIGIFIILHGLVHPIMAVVPQPMEEQTASAPPVFGGFWTTSWLLGDGPTVKTLIYVLSALVALVLIAAGIGFIGSQPWTEIAWLAGTVLSLLLIIVFWNNWLVVGVAIDLALLAVPFATSWLAV